MQRYEYQLVPAPRRGEKVKGVKTTEARFALSLTAVINQMAREGWDYLRADTLPVEERVGLTGRTTTFHHLLVFRRPLDQGASQSGTAASLIADPQPFTATGHPAAPVTGRPLFGGASRGEGPGDLQAAPPVGPADAPGLPPRAGKDQAAE